MIWRVRLAGGSVADRPDLLAAFVLLTYLLQTEGDREKGDFKGITVYFVLLDGMQEMWAAHFFHFLPQKVKSPDRQYMWASALFVPYLV
jgi:hypothetical protein